MKKRPTLADVARAAGVSTMTVSRAVNHKPGLNEMLRQKILKIAEEMDYQPSRLARGLATKQTNTVGLVVPAIAHPLYAQMAQGVEEEASQNGYSVLLINTHADAARETAALDTLWAHDTDGAVLCSYRLSQEVLRKKIQRFPTVVLSNQKIQDLPPHAVLLWMDNSHGAQEAAGHLLRQGRRRIAYISTPEDAYSGPCGLEGYQAALRMANIPFDPAITALTIPGIETGKEAAEQLLRRHPDIDAIFACDDLAAIGALRACQAAGKKVPEEVAVIGAGDLPLASHVHPRLTTLRVDMAGAGRLAMRTLLAMFAGEEVPVSYTIEPALVLRESA